MWGCEDVKMWRCEDVKMWMWRCEDVQMWGYEDVKMWRCEDVRMWRCEDVMWGREDVKMWGCEVVKMWRCDDVKMWKYADPTFRRTLRSDALGKKIIYNQVWNMANLGWKWVNCTLAPWVFTPIYEVLLCVDHALVSWEKVTIWGFQVSRFRETHSRGHCQEKIGCSATTTWEKRGFNHVFFLGCLMSCKFNETRTRPVKTPMMIGLANHLWTVVIPLPVDERIQFPASRIHHVIDS